MTARRNATICLAAIALLAGCGEPPHPTFGQLESAPIHGFEAQIRFPGYNASLVLSSASDAPDVDRIGRAAYELRLSTFAEQNYRPTTRYYLDVDLHVFLRLGGIL